MCTHSHASRPGGPTPGYTSLRLVTPRYASLRLVTPGYTSLRLVTPRHASLRLVKPRYASLRLATPGYTSLRLATARCASINSQARQADLILVMADGNVAEQGSHDELYARRGLYFDLLRREAGGGEAGWAAAGEALEGKVVAVDAVVGGEATVDVTVEAPHPPSS